MQEFMCNVELANANFKAEKSNFKLIEKFAFITNILKINIHQFNSSGNSAYLLEKFENRTLDELYAEYGDLLRIPRRPKSGTYHNAEELNTTETAEFLEWRRNLAKLSEVNKNLPHFIILKYIYTMQGHGVVITPFERNIEIWRQLWRVIERSHLVVQVQISLGFSNI
jgi:large subunit GTPase 1